MNLEIINWLKYIWTHKNWYNNFFLKKTITILLAVWNHRNVPFFIITNVIPIEIIEQARYTYQYAILDNKSTNLNNLKDIAGEKLRDKYNRKRMQDWTPPPYNWLKWNIDTSRIEAKHSSMIGLVSWTSSAY